MNENTRTPVSPFMNVIFRALNYIEVIALTGTAVGFFMLYMTQPGALEILNIFMSLLAAVFFLRAYKPLDVPASKMENDKDRPTGFLGLLGGTIGPKALAIGSAAMTIGILFWFLKLPGAMEMLSIGCSALSAALAVVVIFMIAKPAWSSTLMPLLYRAVPVWLFGIYLFLDNPA